jgi:predicted glycosyltransferase
VMILVTHLLGVGHLTRAALLADGLKAEGFDVTLVSGGRPVPGINSTGWHYVQLLPVHIRGTDFSNLLDDHGLPVTEAVMAERCRTLLNTIRNVKPAVLLTEHFPFGRRQLAGEFLMAIETVRALNPQARVVASVRDVLVAPRRQRKFDQDKIDQANQRINTLFDLVLVHGDEAVLPLEKSWPGTAAIAARLRYTGYITARDPAAPARLHRSDEILVSGGGSAAALPLFARIIAAAHQCNSGESWRILVGNGVTADEFDALRLQAASGARASTIIIERARPDFPALLARCAVSISMAGYNTMLDLVRAKCPAIVVPFDAGQETEQAMRAEAWAAAGLLDVLKADALHPEAILLAIHRARGQARSTSPKLDLNGVARSVSYVKALL